LVGNYLAAPTSHSDEAGEMKIGYLQMNPELGRVDRNLTRIKRLIDGVQADLLVLPEMCTTGYLFLTRDELAEVAEPVVGGRTTTFFQELAAKTDIHLVFGMVEQANRKLYNASVVVDPSGKVHTTYRKVQLFLNEKDLFAPGDRRPFVHTVGDAKIGQMICFDWIFPEIARCLALKGADIICHSANLILPYAQKASVTRAIENRVFFIISNRVGREERGGQRLEFTGQSQIVDPKGNVLVRSDGVSEEVRVVRADLALARDKLVTPRNHILNDRRPEMYVALTEEHGA
jgi:predicted amidohydrolase